MLLWVGLLSTVRLLIDSRTFNIAKMFLLTFYDFQRPEVGLSDNAEGSSNTSAER